MHVRCAVVEKCSRTALPQGNPTELMSNSKTHKMPFLKTDYCAMLIIMIYRQYNSPAIYYQTPPGSPQLPHRGVEIFNYTAENTKRFSPGIKKGICTHLSPLLGPKALHIQHHHCKEIYYELVIFIIMNSAVFKNSLTF